MFDLTMNPHSGITFTTFNSFNNQDFNDFSHPTKAVFPLSLASLTFRIAVESRNQFNGIYYGFSPRLFHSREVSSAAFFPTLFPSVFSSLRMKRSSLWFAIKSTETTKGIS
jgi:hypothetical protein